MSKERAGGLGAGVITGGAGPVVPALWVCSGISGWTEESKRLWVLGPDAVPASPFPFLLQQPLDGP